MWSASVTFQISGTSASCEMNIGFLAGYSSLADAITASTFPCGIGLDSTGGSTSVPSRWPISWW